MTPDAFTRKWKLSTLGERQAALPWILDGAAVRVSLVCFASANDPAGRTAGNRWRRRLETIPVDGARRGLPQ